MARPRLLVAGNWKMHGTLAGLAGIDAVAAGLPQPLSIDVMICPPATLLQKAAEKVSGFPLRIGAQDCHAADSGAFTGDVSASMLRDAGAAAVIVGHSERRKDHGETSRAVRAKARAAIDAGLNVIVCVGETAGERGAGLAEKVCLRQLQDSVPEAVPLARIAIAYEPVWAIGSGATPSVEDISAIHTLLHEKLRSLCPGDGVTGGNILYGGSVTPANADGLFEIAEVDGVLVGGASLKASSFLSIVASANRAAQRRGG